jgi:hypothetical protein
MYFGVDIWHNKKMINNNYLCMPRIPIKTRKLLRKVTRNINNNELKEIIDIFLYEKRIVNEHMIYNLKYVLELELKRTIRKLSRIYLLSEMIRRNEYADIINNRLKRMSRDRLEYLLNYISNIDEEYLIYECKR